jgi:hypothetical protein
VISKVLVIAALVAGIIALFVTKQVLGLDAVQFAALGVILLAVAALIQG